MDYTMNNQSLADLVKRDKKLGRVAGGKPKPGPGGKMGKKPNKMQQQRNQVAAYKNKNQNGQKARMPERIKGRGTGIFKSKQQHKPLVVSKNNSGQRRFVKSTAQGGKGRVMNTSVQNKRGQAQRGISRGKQANDPK